MVEGVPLAGLYAFATSREPEVEFELAISRPDAKSQRITQWRPTPAERVRRIRRKTWLTFLGPRLGRYEIRALIGTGGMGEIYKAADTELERTVALKILPQEFAADPTRMRRFIQEARAASSLNHPNILTIFEIKQD